MLYLHDKERIGKFKEDCKMYSVPCFVSKSVVEELDEKIEQTNEFIGNKLSVLFGEFLKSRGLNEAMPISSMSVIDRVDFAPALKLVNGQFVHKIEIVKKE